MSRRFVEKKTQETGREAAVVIVSMDDLERRLTRSRGHGIPV